MVVDVPKLKLNNGLEMPAIGLGTYGVSCYDFHVVHTVWHSAFGVTLVLIFIIYFFLFFFVKNFFKIDSR